MREEESCVVGDGRVERGGFFEVGDEFGERFRIHDGAGELMGADFSSLFEDVDIFGGELRIRVGGVVFLDEVGEVERAGQACGSGADDEDVGFELFALNGHGDEASLAERGRRRGSWQRVTT